MTEEPTQRIHRPGERAGYGGDAPTTAMPGPLNLAGAADPAAPGRDGAADSSTTDVLSLDELLGPPEPEPATTPSATAPTWTAMPVVAVRSEPIAPAPPAPAPAAPQQAAHTHPPLGDRLRSDAAAAWDGALRRTRAWMGRDDNTLMLLTALVAVCLILAVAAFAR